MPKLFLMLLLVILFTVPSCATVEKWQNASVETQGLQERMTEVLIAFQLGDLDRDGQIQGAQEWLHVLKQLKVVIEGWMDNKPVPVIPLR